MIFLVIMKRFHLIDFSSFLLNKFNKRTVNFLIVLLIVIKMSSLNLDTSDF